MTSPLKRVSRSTTRQDVSTPPTTALAGYNSHIMFNNPANTVFATAKDKGSVVCGNVACDSAAIAQLITSLSQDDSSDAAKRAADQLAALGAGAVNRDAVREGGGIPPLVSMLELGAAPAATQQQAVGALWSLAYNNEANAVAIVRAGGIEPLLLLQNGATSAQDNASAALENIAYYGLI